MYGGRTNCMCCHDAFMCTYSRARISITVHVHALWLSSQWTSTLGTTALMKLPESDQTNICLIAWIKQTIVLRQIRRRWVHGLAPCLHSFPSWGLVAERFGNTLSRSSKASDVKLSYRILHSLTESSAISRLLRTFTMSKFNQACL